MPWQPLQDGLWGFVVADGEVIHTLCRNSKNGLWEFFDSNERNPFRMFLTVEQAIAALGMTDD